MDKGPEEEGQGRGDLIAAQRRETVERLRGRGADPYALSFHKDAHAAGVREEFGDIEPEASTGETRSLAGRVVLLRRHGAVAFAQLRDRSGDLQLFFARDEMPTEDWTLLEDVDLFDIVGATGEVVKTKRP